MRTDIETDKQTNMKLIVTFRNFTKAPKTVCKTTQRINIPRSFSQQASYSTVCAVRSFSQQASYSAVCAVRSFSQQASYSAVCTVPVASNYFTDVKQY